jgi:hypothetical protein
LPQCHPSGSCHECSCQPACCCPHPLAGAHSAAQWPEFEHYIQRQHRPFLLLTNIIAAVAFFSYVLADAC